MKIFSFTTLQYWANAYSFRSMKLVKVFVEKTFKNVKNQVVKWLFSLKGLILFAIFPFFN